LRLLLIHAESFEFKTREKALNEAESLRETIGHISLNNTLVVFTSVEEGDLKGGSEFIEFISNDIIEVARKVNADSITLYPYAHLSNKLASPSEAVEVLKLIEDSIRKKGVKVIRAPFGWYKSFTIKCIGHPLAELSREYKPELTVVRRTLTKKYYIVTPAGDIVDPKEYKFGSDEEDLKILVEKEVFKRELPGGKPRIVDVCRKFGFEWEPMSDAGHMRYGPHATVMMEAVMEYSWRVAKSLGIPIFRVRGTNMFNLKFRPVKEHAELFGDRLYELTSDSEKLVLRYAACHQQFAMIKDWIISYRELPFAAFELADSYRYEQKGETLLCFRLRKFLMPDLHVFTRNLEEAKSMAFKIQEKIFEEIRKLGRSYVSIYNITKDFFDSNIDYIIELVRREGKPVLAVIYPPGIYYWVLNIEYNIIDELRRPREIATLQIDVGNAERFGIKYIDEEGEERHPIIIHTAILGSVERYIYAVLDKAVQDEKAGKVPSLPTWLAPIQARVIPVSSQFIEYAEEVLNKLLEAGVRADLDDRDLALGKKIRDAGIEWIPYIIVVGKREKDTNTINVRIRTSGVQKSMNVEELINAIKQDLHNYPQVDSALPTHLSRRPTLHYLRELAERKKI